MQSIFFFFFFLLLTSCHEQSEWSWPPVHLTVCPGNSWHRKQRPRLTVKRMNNEITRKVHEQQPWSIDFPSFNLHSWMRRRRRRRRTHSIVSNQVICYPKTCDEHRRSWDTHRCRHQVNSILGEKWIRSSAKEEAKETANSYDPSQ